MSVSPSFSSPSISEPRGSCSACDDTSLLCVVIPSTARVHVSLPCRPGRHLSRLAFPGIPPGILQPLCATVYQVWFLLPSLRNSAPALRELPLSPSSSPASPRFLHESVHHSGDPCGLRPIYLLPHLSGSASPPPDIPQLPRSSFLPGTPGVPSLHSMIGVFLPAVVTVWASVSRCRACLSVSPPPSHTHLQKRSLPSRPYTHLCSEETQLVATFTALAFLTLLRAARPSCLPMSWLPGSRPASPASLAASPSAWCARVAAAATPVLALVYEQLALTENWH